MVHLYKKHFIFLLFIQFFVFIGVSCRHNNKTKTFSYHPQGYHYRLISFDVDNVVCGPGKVVWLAATFKTQSDSVFWDSYNNLNDLFYIKTDSSENDNFLRNYVLQCSALDSACLLIKTSDFFRQQFKTTFIPFFSKKDSVVKVNMKVKKVLEKEDFVKIREDLYNKEKEKIMKFYGTSAEMEAAKDPSGFYWIDRTGGSSYNTPQPGDNLTIRYTGYYLNGRFLEGSETDFELVYGTPDQILKGLNYVIGHLKLGENAKIILPSLLAFGENGSSNGTVPPFTPLVYEIKLIDIKTAKPIRKTKG